jgi:hypothetical protein
MKNRAVAPARLIPAAARHQQLGGRPGARIVEAGAERDIHALLFPLRVAGTVEQHHVGLQRRVPVHGRSPERVDAGGAAVPAVGRRDEGRGLAIDELRRGRAVRLQDALVAARQPRAAVPHLRAPGGRIAVGPVHARHRHTNGPAALQVLRVEKVEKLAVGIEHHAEVADAADEIVIGGSAVLGVGRRFDHGAQIPPRQAAIARPRRADARQDLAGARADHVLALLVVVAIPEAAGRVGEHGLEPRAAVRGGPRPADPIEGREAVERQPPALRRLAGRGVEHVQEPPAAHQRPHGGAVGVHVVRERERRGVLEIGGRRSGCLRRRRPRPERPAGQPGQPCRNDQPPHTVTAFSTMNVLFSVSRIVTSIV